MSDQDGPGEGHNSLLDKEDKAEVAKLVDEIIQLKKQKAAIGTQINAKRKQIFTKGITPVAFATALARYEMDVDQRQELDNAIARANDALGIPAQPDLFQESGGGIPDGAA